MPTAGGSERGGKLQTLGSLQPIASPLHTYIWSATSTWSSDDPVPTTSIYPVKEKIQKYRVTVQCSCVRVEMASLYSLHRQKEAGLLKDRTCFKAVIGDYISQYLSSNPVYWSYGVRLLWGTIVY